MKSNVSATQSIAKPSNFTPNSTTTTTKTASTINTIPSASKAATTKNTTTASKSTNSSISNVSSSVNTIVSKSNTTKNPNSSENQLDLSDSSIDLTFFQEELERSFSKEIEKARSYLAQRENSLREWENKLKQDKENLRKEKLQKHYIEIKIHDHTPKLTYEEQVKYRLDTLHKEYDSLHNLQNEIENLINKLNQKSFELSIELSNQSQQILDFNEQKKQLELEKDKFKNKKLKGKQLLALHEIENKLAAMKNDSFQQKFLLKEKKLLSLEKIIKDKYQTLLIKTKEYHLKNPPTRFNIHIQNLINGLNIKTHKDAKKINFEGGAYLNYLDFQYFDREKALKEKEALINMKEAEWNFFEKTTKYYEVVQLYKKFDEAIKNQENKEKSIELKEQSIRIREKTIEEKLIEINLREQKLNENEKLISEREKLLLIQENDYQSRLNLLIEKEKKAKIKETYLDERETNLILRKKNINNLEINEQSYDETDIDLSGEIYFENITNESEVKDIDEIEISSIEIKNNKLNLKYEIDNDQLNEIMSYLEDTQSQDKIIKSLELHKDFDINSKNSLSKKSEPTEIFENERDTFIVEENLLKNEFEIVSGRLSTISDSSKRSNSSLKNNRKNNSQKDKSETSDKYSEISSINGIETHTNVDILNNNRSNLNENVDLNEISFESSSTNSTISTNSTKSTITTEATSKNKFFKLINNSDQSSDESDKNSNNSPNSFHSLRIKLPDPIELVEESYSKNKYQINNSSISTSNDDNLKQLDHQNHKTIELSKTNNHEAIISEPIQTQTKVTNKEMLIESTLEKQDESSQTNELHSNVIAESPINHLKKIIVSSPSSLPYQAPKSPTQNELSRNSPKSNLASSNLTSPNSKTNQLKQDSKPFSNENNDSKMNHHLYKIDQEDSLEDKLSQASESNSLTESISSESEILLYTIQWNSEKRMFDRIPIPK